ncbi:hypothetical protein BJX96DRAFT_155050 [Aspergillus floccosus]
MLDVGQASTRRNVLGGLRQGSGYTQGSLRSLTLGMHREEKWNARRPNLRKMFSRIGELSLTSPYSRGSIF